MNSCCVPAPAEAPSLNYFLPGVDGSGSDDYQRFFNLMEQRGMSRPTEAASYPAGQEGLNVVRALLKAAPVAGPTFDREAQRLAARIASDYDNSPARPSQVNVIANSGGNVVAMNALHMLSSARPDISIDNLVMVSAFAPERAPSSDVRQTLRVGQAISVESWGDYFDYAGGPRVRNTLTTYGTGHAGPFDSCRHRALVVDHVAANNVR